MSVVLPSSRAKIRPVEFARRLIKIKLDNEAEINPNLINDYMNKTYANFEASVQAIGPWKAERETCIGKRVEQKEE